MNYTLKLNPRQLNLLGDVLLLYPITDMDKLRLQTSILVKVGDYLKDRPKKNEEILESRKKEIKADKDGKQPLDEAGKPIKQILPEDYEAVEKEIDDYIYALSLEQKELEFTKFILNSFLSKHSSKQMPDTIYKRYGGETYVEIYNKVLEWDFMLEPAKKISTKEKIMNFIHKIV